MPTNCLLITTPYEACLCNDKCGVTCKFTDTRKCAKEHDPQNMYLFPYVT